MNSAHRQLMVETQSDVDLHQLLVPSPVNDVTPYKDSASTSSGPSSDAGSFAFPEALSRSNSVYSFSRASFSSQLNGLTSMSLPNAESLAATIAALSTARKAIRALHSAADQIQQWTKKALKVLDNLDADEDVEWAAAAGREGLTDTEKTINKFEHLINVYVLSIEELQLRPDIGDVKADDLQTVVEQMEITLDGWSNVRLNLKRVHEQVEIAMEWEELWSKVLGDVGVEMDSLSQLVFEMEEKRHMAFQTQATASPSQTIDLNELESFIDEPKGARTTPNARFSLPPAFDAAALVSPTVDNAQDDSQLLALFARMQPLRASLDFLPMRLAMFQNRAERMFPNACKELHDKRDRLERNWTDLSKEAETLRRELSEDRWVIVFRNAGRQAQKMYESVERSVSKVQEALDAGYQRTNPAALGKRIESYEAKKMHYGPAIQRVLGIIQKGLKDRLTVNGEILRLHKDLSSRFRDLSDAMEDLDNVLEPVSSKHNSQLRESISSIVSAARSFSSGTLAGTPGTSPASSVDLPPHRQDKPTAKYGLNGYSKPRSVSSTRPPPLSSQNKHQTLLSQNRRPTTPLSSHSGHNLPRRGVSPSPAPPSVYRQGVYTPATAPLPKRPMPTPFANKPRWSSTVKPDEATLAPTYRSSSAMVTPTTDRKYTPRSISSSTALPLRSPLSRETTSSPALPSPSIAPESLQDTQQFKSFAERVRNPSPNRPGGVMDPLPYHRSRNATAPVTGTIRSPSSLIVPNNTKPSPSNTTTIKPVLTQNRNPSQGIPPRKSSLLPRTGPQSDRGSIELDPQQDNRSEYGEENDVVIEPGSSPLSKKTIVRPGSVLAMNVRARRTSLLPVPVRSASRQGSVGSKTG